MFGFSFFSHFLRRGLFFYFMASLFFASSVMVFSSCSRSAYSQAKRKQKGLGKKGKGRPCPCPSKGFVVYEQ